MRRLHDRRVRIRWAFLVACIALPLGLAAAASTGGETKHGLPVARIVEARGVSGEPDRLFDALVKPEGALWNSKGTLVLTSLDSALIIDLGAPTQVSGILLQGDNNDRYAIDASEDGHGWMTALVSYKSEEGAGLRTRCHRLPSPVSMRFARIRPETGDGKYSLSELQFYSTIPDAWPPPLKIDSQLYPIVLPGSILMSDVLQLAVLPILALLLLSPRTVRIQAKRTPALFGVGALLVVLGAHGWVHRNSSEWFDRERYLIQIGLMLVAILLSKAGGMSCKRRGEEMLQPNTDDHSGQVTRTGCASGSSSGSRSSANLLSRLLLVSTLCLSIGCYLNFGRFHGNNRIHYYDFTHYLLGSVYFEEMGYHGLYLALLQADQEGRGFLDPDSEIRNLEINKLVKSREFTSQSIQIKERFSPERWKAFQADVDYFQGQLGREGFQKLVKDHGYNPSPIWTMVGGTLGRLLASTGRGTAFCAEFLSFLDPILLLTAVLALILATGVEAGCLAGIYLFVNPFVPYDYTGGAFLRMDWLVALIVGLCLMRRGNWALGGCLLSYPAGTRIFPAVFWLIPAASAVRSIWRQERLDPRLRSAFLGAIAGSSILLAGSAVIVGGPNIWKSFVSNAREHNAGSYRNHIALRNLILFDRERVSEAYGQDWQAWGDDRQERLGSLSTSHGLILIACTFSSLLIFGRRDPLTAFHLGGFLPFILFYPANYYLNFLIPVVMFQIVEDRSKYQQLAGLMIVATAGRFLIPDFELFNLFLGWNVFVWFAWVHWIGASRASHEAPERQSNEHSPR